MIRFSMYRSKNTKNEQRKKGYVFLYIYLHTYISGPCWTLNHWCMSILFHRPNQTKLCFDTTQVPSGWRRTTWKKISGYRQLLLPGQLSTAAIADRHEETTSKIHPGSISDVSIFNSWMCFVLLIYFRTLVKVWTV